MTDSPVLSPKAYDEAEARGTAHLSIPHMMAYKPYAFERVGWPTRVSLEAELARYVDHNFEDEVAGLFKPGAEFAPAAYRNSFTLNEQALLASVRDRVAEVTEAWFGRRIKPVSNILVQVAPYRVISRLSEAFAMPGLSVFEVGAGAGYLGALLAATGYRYASMDNAQSLYLWQSRLLQAVAGKDFVDIAADDAVATYLADLVTPSPSLADRMRNPRATASELKQKLRGIVQAAPAAMPGQAELEVAQKVLSTARVAHIPWWTYVRLLGGTSVRTDVVYSNSNLGEMSRMALRHVLHISRMMLSESRLGVFCFISKGSPAQLTFEEIDQEFEIFGYHKVMDAPFFAYVVNPERAAAVKSAFTDGIPDYNPSKRPERVSANEMVPLKRSEAPLDTQLAQWWHGWQPPFID